MNNAEAVNTMPPDELTSFLALDKTDRSVKLVGSYA